MRIPGAVWLFIAHVLPKGPLYQLVGCMQAVGLAFHVSLHEGASRFWCKMGTSHPHVDHPTGWHPSGARTGPNLNQVLKDTKTYTFYHSVNFPKKPCVTGQNLAFGWWESGCACWLSLLTCTCHHCSVP
jgi:hypothetical protein